VKEPLKQLMQDLGNAINDSLSDSDRIAEAIGELKRAGYDIFLVLEATIGFNKREETPATVEEQKDKQEVREQKESYENGEIKFTTQDQRFLRALKIAADDQK
jgi:hypothetical protein